ncbi:MAG: M14 family zinc carboxypeptidase [Saprospiraceae bacterium]
MRSYLLSLLLSGLFLSPLLSQTTLYHKTRIRLEGRQLEELLALGIDTDHGEYAPYRHLTNDLSDAELQLLTEAGFDYEILIRDVTDFYSNPSRRAAWNAHARGGNPCEETPTGEVNSYPVPEHFRLGSMAGFYTYQEMLDILDSMRLLYPDLVSPRRIVAPDILTYEGRPLYWLRISDNPDTDEASEPEVFYNALHHAREPNSLTQLIYFMWYVLENYETNPEVRFLLDNTELYIMPCINPDGYIHNENIAPNGGGMWRKNRSTNGDGTRGVDLNRNYGYEWGYDDFGSSPNPASEVYRGPSGFSEPETQAVRAFCNAHQFEVALNYHTFGDLLIYPWGYIDSPTQDAPTFNNLANIFTLENNYLAGVGTETVGYTTNGDSDDWMYGENATKPAILSMTPEVGSSFWPDVDEIIPNCQATMWMNIAAANTPHVAGLAIADDTQMEINTDHLFFRFTLQRFGLQDGSLTVSLTPLNPELVTVAEGAKTFNLPLNGIAADSFALSVVAGNIPPGTPIRFLLGVDNGDFVRTDTVVRVFGGFNDTNAFADDFQNIGAWESGSDWNLTDEDFYTAPYSLTDSPYASYPNNHFATMRLAEPITVGEAEEYRIQFRAKWDIESFYDWAQLRLQINGGDWMPACGQYTVPGSELQDFNNPIWEGRQETWVLESIDLTGLVTAGDQIRLEFALLSDAFVNPDGFYVDDLVLQERNMNTVSTQTPILSQDFEITTLPNPVQDRIQVQYRLPAAISGTGQWQLWHSNAQLAAAGQMDVQAGFGKLTIPVADLASGVYWLAGWIDGHNLPTQKIVVVK